MVLCPHCDSDMDLNMIIESENFDDNFYEAALYRCPLCCSKYLVSDKFVLKERKVTKLTDDEESE